MNRKCFILISLVFFACTNDESLPKLLIATDATFAPFHLIDDAGRTTGFDIELARAVATNAGYEPTVIVLSYDDLFAGLLAGTHDVVAATTGITPEREKIYAFSDPYFSTCQVAVVRAGPGEPEAVSDLKDRRIGAAGSGTSARAMILIDGVHTRINDGEGVDALLLRNIDAWIVDEFDAVGVAKNSGNRLRVIPGGIVQEEYGFVLAQNRTELQTALNQSLKKLANEGTIDKLRVEFDLDRGTGWPVQCADL